MIAPDDHMHFPHDTDKGWSMCGRQLSQGSGHGATIFVDWVGCSDCLLLEGFRFEDPVKRAEQDTTASMLKFRLRQQYLDGGPGGMKP